MDVSLFYMYICSLKEAYVYLNLLAFQRYTLETQKRLGILEGAQREKEISFARQYGGNKNH